MSVTLNTNTQALPVYLVDETGDPASAGGGGTTSAVTVTGNVVQYAADTGGPVKIGSVYHANLASYTDGQRTDLAVGSNGQVLQQSLGSGNVNCGQVSVGTTATQVAPSRPNRSKVIISSTVPTVYYVGQSTVTPTSGLYVAGVAGASLELDSTAAIYCVVASGTAVLSYLELY